MFLKDLRVTNLVHVLVFPLVPLSCSQGCKGSGNRWFFTLEADYSSWCCNSPCRYLFLHTNQAAHICLGSAFSFQWVNLQAWSWKPALALCRETMLSKAVYVVAKELLTFCLNYLWEGLRFYSIGSAQLQRHNFNHSIWNVFITFTFSPQNTLWIPTAGTNGRPFADLHWHVPGKQPMDVTITREALGYSSL